MTGYLDQVIRSLILIMPKMSGYVKTFKVKNEGEDKNNKLMPFYIDDEKLLEKYKTIWTKVEYLKNCIKCFTSLWWYILKTKIRTYGDKVHTNFCCLNVSEMVKNVNLLQSFLLILYLFTKANIPASIFR